MAQMVTPSACSTTSIRTLAGSLLRPRFTATTSTSAPPAPEASMDPFTPTISMVLPAATGPCQRNSLPCDCWEGEPDRPATTINDGRSTAMVSWSAGRKPYGGPVGRDSHRQLDTAAG